MDSISEFLGMGGYAGFVWPAFAITAVVLIGLLIASLRTLRMREAELRALEAGSERRGTADAASGVAAGTKGSADGA